MAVWQRPARTGLASFAVTFAATLLYGVSDRGGPPAAPAAPTDPAAVLESRGARTTLGDGSVITADRQFIYDDESARLLGVEVTVPAGEDSAGFRIRGGEAAGVQATGDWRLAGAVDMETGDGLSGRTEEASYVDATGIVTMPQPARFEQGWMRLEGDAARYDRRRGVVHLERRAVVELQTTGDGDSPGTRIAAGTAEIDRLAGVMRFVDGATIEAAGRRMRAAAVVVGFDPDASLIDAIELNGEARVFGPQDAETGLREMAAETITVTYRDGEPERATLDGDARLQGRDTGPGQIRALSAPTIVVAYRDGAPAQATMTGGAQVVLFGAQPGAEGPAIEGGSIEMALRAGAGGIDELRARSDVTLTFPAGERRRRRIRARTLDIGNPPEGPAATETAERPATSPEAATDPEGLAAVFEGNVEMRESGAAGGARNVRADRLEAVLAEGLGRLAQTRFLGGVTLDAEGIAGRAEQAAYAPEEALFILLMTDAGSTPRMDDERGFVQASTIAIDLDGSNIEATGDVKGVLGGAEAAAAPTAVRPGLFAEGDPIHFVAQQFSYDAGQSLASYDGGARLWQGSTEFRGQRIVIDETTGNITAEGGVQTRTTMLQQDEASDAAVETATAGMAETLSYDNPGRRLAYAAGATLGSPLSTLAGEEIELFLHEDARTLDRIQATGDVTLELESRSVTAATLTYDDATGRYDLTGEPVSVTERTGGACRRTTGRSVTFYAAGDSIAADGQAAERTASTGGTC